MSRTLYVEQLLKHTSLEHDILERMPRRQLKRLYDTHCASRKLQHEHDNMIRQWDIFDNLECSTNDKDEKNNDFDKKEEEDKDHEQYYEKMTKEFLACYDIYERVHGSVQSCRAFIERNEEKLNEYDKRVLQRQIERNLKKLNVLYKRLLVIRVTVHEGLSNTQMIQTDLMRSLQNMTNEDQQSLIDHFALKIQKFQSLQEQINERFQHLIHVLQRP